MCLLLCFLCCYIYIFFGNKDSVRSLSISNENRFKICCFCVDLDRIYSLVLVDSMHVCYKESMEKISKRENIECGKWITTIRHVDSNAGSKNFCYPNLGPINSNQWNWVWVRNFWNRRILLPTLTS